MTDRTETRSDQPSVLLASDGSKSSIEAERWLVAADWRQSPVIDVVCVAQPSITRLGWNFEVSRGRAWKAVEAIRQGEMLAAQRIANEIGARLQEHGLNVRTWARSGDVPDEIQAMADELRPQFIAVGPRGRSELVRALLGSVTIHLVDQCSWPVMVIRDMPPLVRGRRPSHVVVIVDSEPGARRSIERLADIGWLAPERLTLLGLTGLESGLADDDPLLAAQVGSLVEGELQAILERLAGAMPPGVTPAELEIRTGHPVRAAVDAVTSVGADLVVVARSLRRRGVDPFATNIARHMPTSVLVIPPPA